MGKKYIIEIPEDKITDFVGSTHFFMPYMMAGHIGHHDTGLPIVPYTEPDLELIKEKAHTNGYSEGYQDGYSKGMNDYLQNPEVKEESDRAYAHGYSDAESKFSEIRKEAYEQGQKDLRESCVPQDEEAYGIGYNEGFQCGLDLAWDAARKLYEIDWDILCNLFGKVSVRSEVLDMFTASEVLQKLRIYEQEKEEIKVGDEVIATSGKAVIIDINDDKDKARYIYSDSTLGFDNVCNLSKTGRHFPEFATVLEKMRNESNEQIDT